MKKKIESNRSRQDIILAKALRYLLLIIIVLILLFVFALWFIEDRPQYIEFPLPPTSTEGWQYIEFSTRHDSYGHYWIVRYQAICISDCEECLSQFDYFESELKIGWSTVDNMGPLADYCYQYFPELSNDNLIELHHYRDGSGFPFAHICVTIEKTVDDDFKLNVFTINPSPMTSLSISM